MTRLENDEVHIWRANSDRPADLEALMEMLGGRETERYDRFFQPQDSRRFAIAHAALRSVLASYLDLAPRDVQFVSGDYGKPQLSSAISDGLCFNMSHSQDIILIAVTRSRDVGVDVERMRADFPFLDTARSYFSPGEYSLLRSVPVDRRPEAFFTLWTRKEACIKAAGKGLHLPLADVDMSAESFDKQGREIVVEGDRYSIADLVPAPGYAGAVAVKGAMPGIKMREWPRAP